MTENRLTSVVLCAVGDVMLGDHPVCYGHGVRSSIDRLGIDEFFGDARRVFAGADIVTGNLEATLSYEGLESGSLESEEMRGRPEFAAGLARVGFNVMTVANNHALHHGDRAFVDTCKLLSQNEIGAVGVSEGMELSNVWSFTKEGLKIGIIGYSARPEKYRPGFDTYVHGDGERLVEQVKRLISEFSFLIVSIHWGEEYLPVPSPLQVQLGHRLIDAGAAVVLGHHPHVLQGIERYKRGLIAYSLGNFVFDHWETSGRESAVLRFRMSAMGIDEVEVVPMWIGDDFRPTIATGAIKRRIEANISSLSSRVGEYADPVRHLATYQDLANRAYQRYRLESYRYFLTHIWKYRPSIIRQSFQRALRRRVGTTGY